MIYPGFSHVAGAMADRAGTIYTAARCLTRISLARDWLMDCHVYREYMGGQRGGRQAFRLGYFPCWICREIMQRGIIWGLAMYVLD